MGSEEPAGPGLTVKGERTRARIVAAAARLIYERGVDTLLQLARNDQG